MILIEAYRLHVNRLELELRNATLQREKLALEHMDAEETELLLGNRNKKMECQQLQQSNADLEAIIKAVLQEGKRTGVKLGLKNKSMDLKAELAALGLNEDGSKRKK
jgi:hypothetical protein